MEVSTKTIIGQIVPANEVPPMVHPTRTTAETKYLAQKGWVLEALDLQGHEEWPESEQKQARELLLKWEHLFTHSNLDVGKTALTKHKIKLTDQTPFKEHNRCIPPHMYDDVGGHIQEMLDISAICQFAQSMGQCSGPSLEKRLGFYECKRMPFRLTNAPATFKRLMENCLGDLNLHRCII